MMDRLRALSILPALAVAAAVLALWGTDASAAPKQKKPGGPAPSVEASSSRSRSEAIKEVLPSSVRISVSAGGEPLRSASGVVLGVRGSGAERVGYVMTNAHVVASQAEPEGAPERIEVLVDRQGKTTRVAAKVIAMGSVPDRDLALLEVPGLEASPAALVQDRELELGDEVIAVGAPFGRGLSVSSGIVSQLELAESGLVTSLKTDAPIGYGASGGGIFRVSDGKLIAVVEGYRTVKVSFPVEEKNFSFDVPMPGETFAAPVTKIRGFLREKGLLHVLGSDPGERGDLASKGAQ